MLMKCTINPRSSYWIAQRESWAEQTYTSTRSSKWFISHYQPCEWVRVLCIRHFGKKLRNLAMYSKYKIKACRHKPAHHVENPPQFNSKQLQCCKQRIGWHPSFLFFFFYTEQRTRYIGGRLYKSLASDRRARTRLRGRETDRQKEKTLSLL